jgi:hypothetical protein
LYPTPGGKNHDFSVIASKSHDIIAIDIVQNKRYDTDMTGIDGAIKLYLQQVLGAKPAISAWETARQLPYFLQDAYVFRSCQILGRKLVLAIDRRGQRLLGRDLRTQFARIAAIADLPVIYVVNSLASHERRSLVDKKIPFIVPGNQLYLPMLGIDFREYFRQPTKPQNRPLSPATQAILISALMRKLWVTEWAPEGIATELGYGAMTASRAAQELAVPGIATRVVRGRLHLLRFEGPAADVWEKAKPVLRSPITQSVWATFHGKPSAKLDPLPAGQSALALYSTIGDPKWPTYAVGNSTWRTAARHNVDILSDPEEGASELQLWSYSPRLAIGGQRTVDPLSLTLSLEDSTDERIQIALEELKERFPWSEA